MGKKRGSYSSPVKVFLGWFGKRSMKVRALMCIVLMCFSVVAIKFLIKDLRKLFVASEAVHLVGIVILIYKLTVHKTCSGISLKSQELTAIFLSARSICSFVMERDIHTVLDLTTLVSTLWLIYTIRFKLKSTYIKELDNMPLYYVVVPSVILAIFIHPYAMYTKIWHMLYAFSMYTESVSVLPQLRHMRNAKVVEPCTAHYVFALGVARFLSCAHWIIQVYVTRGAFIYLVTSSYIWFPAILIAEFIQTFILADFCYYYIKSLSAGQLMLRMPV